MKWNSHVELTSGHHIKYAIIKCILNKELYETLYLYSYKLIQNLIYRHFGYIKSKTTVQADLK